MKRKARSLALRLNGDSAKMAATVDWAVAHNLEIYRPCPISYWIEGYIFWPNAGTIQRAGNQKKLKQYGLKGLAEVLGLPEASPDARRMRIVDPEDSLTLGGKCHDPLFTGST